MIRKLQSNHGETLAETMVAALIGVIALLLLASMIMASSKLVTKSGTTIANLYDNMKQMDTKSTETVKEKVKIKWKVASGIEKSFDVEVKKNTSDSFEAYEVE